MQSSKGFILQVGDMEKDQCWSKLGMCRTSQSIWWTEAFESSSPLSLYRNVPRRRKQERACWLPCFCKVPLGSPEAHGAPWYMGSSCAHCNSVDLGTVTQVGAWRPRCAEARGQLGPALPPQMLTLPSQTNLGTRISCTCPLVFNVYYSQCFSLI